MTNQKSYYSIIPAHVRYDDRLNPRAILLYGEISALCNEKGYCWANNRYFADLYKVDPKTVSRWISKLKRFGYIKTREKRGIERKIYLSEAYRVLTKKSRGYTQKDHGGIDKKVKGGIRKKITHNNTSINNKENIKTNIGESDNSQQQQQEKIDSLEKMHEHFDKHPEKWEEFKKIVESERLKDSSGKKEKSSAKKEKDFWCHEERIKGSAYHQCDKQCQNCQDEVKMNLDGMENEKGPACFIDFGNGNTLHGNTELANKLNESLLIPPNPEEPQSPEPKKETIPIVKGKWVEAGPSWMGEDNARIENDKITQIEQYLRTSSSARVTAAKGICKGKGWNYETQTHDYALMTFDTYKFPLTTYEKGILSTRFLQHVKSWNPHKSNNKPRFENLTSDQTTKFNYV